MGFNSVGGGNMNVSITMGGTQGAGSGDNGGVEGMRLSFDNSKEKLDNNPGDQGALQDLRTLKKDVDSALQKETAKENSGEAKMQDTLEQLLQMIMDLLQQVIGGDEEEEEGKGKGKGEGGCGGKHKGKPEGQGQGQGSGGLTLQINL
jgi:hypothetical protein